MPMSALISKLWKRLMLSRTAFANRHGKLRMVYMLDDPWEMASDREQHRFAQTNAQLAAIQPHYASILELGSGEGHQSLFLQQLCDRLSGVELSERAVERARQRCPTARFVVGGVDDAAALFPGERFDLVTACEVLYYASEPAAILAALQQRSPRIYVSAYRLRFDQMRHLFNGPGWRSLPTITHGDTIWDCAIWEAA
jgi:SAM-dependent methyltransferase